MSNHATPTIGDSPFRDVYRDGSVSVRLKGNMWKGPFHLPRMLWYCGRLLDEPQTARPA
jgi:hypothetical protein